MSEHKHGTMDITTQQQTYDGFIKFVSRSIIGIIVVLIFMALVGG